MPIRKRLTAPTAKETIHFHKYLAEGAPPPPPRLPFPQERKEIYDALHSIPVGKLFSQEEWNQRWLVPFLRKTYALWGVTLALYPTCTKEMSGRNRCYGVLVLMLERQNGRQHKIQLVGSPKDWYGRIISWIREVRYND